MSLDRFVDQYIRLISVEIEQCKDVLCTKDFKKRSEFCKEQGKLQAFTEALRLLRGIPEDE